MVCGVSEDWMIAPIAFKNSLLLYCCEITLFYFSGSSSPHKLLDIRRLHEDTQHFPRTLRLRPRGRHHGTLLLPLLTPLSLLTLLTC
jgi:hypothetical protein